MEIILGKTAGFCYGVKNAVSNAEKKLKEYKQLSCLGELVHNGEVVKKLEKMGLKIVNKLEDAGDKIIIRAHGIEKQTYEKASRMNIQLIDYTCPKVLKIHDIATEYCKKGYFIFLIGTKKHPESIGTLSFCGKQSFFIETKDQIINGITLLKQSGIKKLLIIVQTTFSIEKYNEYIEEIKKNIPTDVNIEIKNTICSATKMRQDETKTLSKLVDCMIIIGGKNSSNTRKLYDIAMKNCNNTFLIETKDELENNQFTDFNKIGIMAGASTPKESINEVIEKIKKGE